MLRQEDTIVAPATAEGGALSIIRVSGSEAIALCEQLFRSPSGKKLSTQPGNTIIFGFLSDNTGDFIDEVVVSLFRAPHSYTSEDLVEISAHGSRYITSRIIQSLISLGARSADPGEFTMRAFLAGKMDLSQAEAVADLISSHDRATHSLATTQMRGGYSSELSELRGELLRLAALLELELDFSEEDVVFADRTQLLEIIHHLSTKLKLMEDSFRLGNAIKGGIGVAIAGSPNVGKSTLLNLLLKEDRAIVSDIPGTTRDIIEEKINLNGINYRFIDTAGIRESGDKLEMMGIDRTRIAVKNAKIILYVIDRSETTSPETVLSNISDLETSEDQKIAIIINKCDDKSDIIQCTEAWKGFQYPIIPISAKFNINIKGLINFLAASIDIDSAYQGDVIVSNYRHYDNLLKSRESLERASASLELGLSSDLIVQDIRQSLYYLGLISGEITTDEILSEIFSKFCIGK